jgi:murein DD-endopeptidase MepM/ murein hydrolase activator NlpD
MFSKGSQASNPQLQDAETTDLSRFGKWLNYLAFIMPSISKTIQIRKRLIIGGLILIGLTVWVVNNAESTPIETTEYDTQDQTSEIVVPSSNHGIINVSDLPAFNVGVQAKAGIRRLIEVHTIIPTRPRLEILEYNVQQGDSLFGIAEKFNLKPETILWGNFDVLEDNPHSLRPGQILNILPIDGTYYEWNEGDSLDVVASYFGVTLQDILDWPGNELRPDSSQNSDIEIGTPIVIPNGTREFISWQAPRITRQNPAVAKISGPGACGSVYDGPVGEGFFIWPTTANFLSGNGYSSYHPGIDIGGSIGNAIYASASGVVVYAGWNTYGYGYMVVVDHGDGWQTLYAHMSQVNVACGQAVFQGVVIGGVGSSGNSTGAHLHFEMQSDIYGKVNPYNYTSP